MTRILLAEDHRILREGLRNLLSTASGLEVIAEAADGREAVEKVATASPDLVLMDLGMPGLNGIDATHKIRKENTDVKILVLSMHSDRRMVSESLRAGANGYVLKGSSTEELVRAIQSVMAGNTYLCPEVAGIVVDGYLNRDPHSPPPTASVLTAREREVLQLLAEGGSTKEIASKLELSPKTVDTHRQQIMKKLGLHSVAELTKYAIRAGLTTLEE